MQGQPTPPASRRRAYSKDSDFGAPSFPLDALEPGGAHPAGAKSRRKEDSPLLSPKPGAVKFDEEAAFDSPFRSAFALPLHGGSLYNTPVPVRVGGNGLPSQTPLDMEILPTFPTSVKASKKLFSQHDDSQFSNDAPLPTSPALSSQSGGNGPSQSVTLDGENGNGSALANLKSAALEAHTPAPSFASKLVKAESAKSSGRIKRTKSSENTIPAAAASPVVSLSRFLAGPTPKESTRPCNCKKSHCLKLYCECFAANLFCGLNCRCSACENNVCFSSHGLVKVFL